MNKLGLATTSSPQTPKETRWVTALLLITLSESEDPEASRYVFMVHVRSYEFLRLLQESGIIRRHSI